MKAFIFLTLFAISLSSTVFARSPLGLKEAIKLALEKNNLVKAAEYEQTAARREAEASRSRFFPRIFLNETATDSNAPTQVFMMKLDEGRFTQNDFNITNLNHPSAHSDFRTAVTLDQPLFDANIVSGAEMAGKEEKVRNFALERRRQEIAYMVYCAYLEVQKSRGYLKAAEQAVADALEHRRLAEARGKAGVGLKSDELRARTFLAEMEEQNITARNNLDLAGLRLSQLVGDGPGESADIMEELKPLPMELGLADLVRLAGDNRQDLKELEMDAEKAAVGVRQARASYLPTLYGTASYQMNDRDIPFGRDNDSWTVGASLRWELFDGLRRENEKGKADALHNSATEYLENYRKEITIQVEESRLRREEAGKRLEVSRHSVEDAEEVVRLISRRFENSIATFAELLDAQTSLNRARAQLIGNESDYAQSTARLYFATGTFLKEVMQ